MSNPLRIIPEAQVEELLTMKIALDVNENAFAALHKEQANVPLRAKIPIDEHKGMTLFKPAYVAPSGLGLKVVSVRPNNVEKGLPTVPGTILLMDAVTGLPAALMGATYLTGVRTAAGSGVASKYLSREDSARLVIFGAGMQARYHFHAVSAVRPIKHVHFVNRSLQRAADLVDDLSKQFPDVTFVALQYSPASATEAQTAAARDATRQADIICTTTNSSTPLFDGSWVPDGCHVNCIGSYRPDMQEVDVALVGRARIVLDTPGAAQEAGDIIEAVKAGKVDTKSLKTLGEVVATQTSVRESPKSITLFKSVGTAVQDVATARAVLDAAIQQGVGTEAHL